MKLELKYLSPYFPYGLNIKILNYKCDYVGIEYGKASGFYFIADLLHITYDGLSNGKHVDAFKPILRPISDLVKNINWGLQTYSFIDLFEIGDTGGCIWEFDNGNIKTIQKLETIAKYNVINDIDYLPYAVVQLMFEYQFDVFGLIDAGLAIDINTVPELLNG